MSFIPHPDWFYDDEIDPAEHYGPGRLFSALENAAADRPDEDCDHLPVAA